MNREASKSNTAAVWMFQTAIFAASAFLPLPDTTGQIAHLPSVCPFYNMTGLPCPGCGLTRAFVCLGHGRWLDSLHWHPLGWLLALILAVLWMRNGIFLLRGITPWSLSPTLQSRLAWAGLALLLLFSVARISWLTANHLHF